MGLEDVIADFATDIEAIAPVYFGDRERATFNVPPTYVWVPNSSTYEAPRVVGGNPKALYDQVTESSVYCWGEDDTDARLLERVLIVSLRSRYGAGMQIVSTEYGKPDWMTLGYVAIVRILSRVPMCEITWPETLAAREAIREANPALANAKWSAFLSEGAPTFQFTKVAIAPGTPHAGDGLLTGLEG